MSLAKFVRDLGAATKARGCPHPVTLGPERTKAAGYGTTRVIVERQRGAGVDSALPVRSQHNAPKLIGIRDVGVKLTTYARSSVTGARLQDHQDLAERLTNFALDDINTLAATGKTTWALGPGGFIVLEDAEGSEVDGGAVYEQLITIADGIPRIAEDVTWAELMADHAAGVERPGAADEVEIVAIMQGGPTVTFAEVGATGDTITRSFGSWTDDGFEAGDEITVTGSASNNVTGTIASLTALVITLGDTDLTAEGPVSGVAVAVTGGVAFSSSGTTLDASSTADP